jgi:mannose-6-phosphate isomerase-like protein (cupin superfamily)
MRTVLLLSFVLAVHPAGAQTPTQKPAPTPQQQTGTQPAKPQPPPTTPSAPRPTPPPSTTAPRRPAAPTTRGGLAITVTSPQGATLPDIRVQLSGPTDRAEQTNASGQLTMPSLLTGTYRLRFDGEKWISFEKEVTVQTGKVTEVDVILNPAPEPKIVAVPTAPATTPTPTIGPKGDAHTVGVVQTLEKEYVGKQPRRESLLACTGNLRTSMIQLNDPMPARLYDSADAMYYVLGGEGTVQMDGADKKLATYDFVSVPRGTSHSFTRRGTRALVLLAVLSGEPCEQAK